MRRIRDIGLNLLCGGLVVVAGACTRTPEAERPEQAKPARPEQAKPARPAPTDAAGADETFAPTAGNRLANDSDASGAGAPAPGPEAESTGHSSAPDAEGAPPTAATDSSNATPAGPDARGNAREMAPSAPAAPLTHVITVPEGTSLPLVLTSAVASDSSQVEDPVTARLASNVDVEGMAAIPEGAVVRGTVSEVRRSGRVKGVARLGIRFHTLVIGEQSYDIQTGPVSRQAKGTVKKDTQKVAIPAAAGGVIGAIAGGGKGAAIGAAAGAAAGTGAVLATRGQEVRLASGSRVTTTLSAPLDVTVKN